MIHQLSNKYNHRVYFTSQHFLLLIAEEVPDAQRAVVRTGHELTVRRAEAKCNNNNNRKLVSQEGLLM